MIWNTKENAHRHTRELVVAVRLSVCVGPMQAGPASIMLRIYNCVYVVAHIIAVASRQPAGRRMAMVMMMIGVNASLAVCTHAY